MLDKSFLSVFLMLSIPSVIGGVAYLTCRRFSLTSTHLFLAISFYLVLAIFPPMSSPGIIVGGTCFILSVVVSLVGALTHKHLVEGHGTTQNSPYRLLLTATVISVAVGLALIDFVQEMAQDEESLALFYVATLMLSPSLMPFLVWMIRVSESPHESGDD